MKRNDFLAHVGWTGAGIAYVLTAHGVVRAADDVPDGPFFVQISDSHIGFHQPANPDVSATLQAAVTRINALPRTPDFVIHTGDVTHLSKPEQFDTAKQILSSLKAPLIVIPGEHDVLGSPQAFAAAFPPKSGSSGWFSWDAGGVHYVALVNVFDFEKMGELGNEQLAWLETDLKSLPASRPIVVFTHVPLYALYAKWGWTTDDGAKALALLTRFDAVTVLNGHIHQVIEHREGNIRFASANATAYPQPAPGAAGAPGPVTLAHDALLRVIGYRTVELHGGDATVRNVTLG
ncbi:MAG TPA: metallophosphoesterase [Candidatus Baltobacteraceae bacterium]|nr:metallophosphoesterase [Candidatus Baltobacteraceae bacterium]